ncbi:hypothetical protein PL8927_680011 [Planktothrix serta PCC 8927]|uniref:Uncharacterized protein n=1 Tax=Planktothrix serta PCC 8927 TaxID=671068 RepID=A0A7Z9BPV7_9CYAN|nr:hypothetical protein PL8927_680011 [Planktothrix serta PCC 8927]
MSATIQSSTGLMRFSEGLGKEITLILLEFIRVSGALSVYSGVDSWEIGKFGFTFL